MNKSIIISLAFCATVAVTLAKPAPQASEKEMSNEIIPQGEFKRNGDSVSASWGGFQASAGLSDTGAVASAGGNGLGAGAGYGVGGVGASAGVAGNGNKQGAAYGAGVVGQPGHQVAGQGFFDRIFAIPVSVLQSVNTYLNNRPATVRKAVVVSQGGSGYAASAGSVGNVNGNVPVSGSIGTAGSGVDYGTSVAGASASAGAVAGSGPVVQKNYDQIFNIPITALRSVQNLLNGKK